MTITIHHGDSLVVLPTLPANSIDSAITDPPYCLDSIRNRFGKEGSKAPVATNSPYSRGAKGFMGMVWDDDIAFRPDIWREVYRVLKPGAYLVAFGGTRTHHRLMVAIEDAGFEIRDTLCWLYSTGFPKSHSVSKAIDKAAGREREIVGVSENNRDRARDTISWDQGKPCLITTPASDEARQWNGWGTGLSPGYEPIVLARKPLEGTVAQNVLKWGTGAINIDECRVEGEIDPANSKRLGKSYGDAESDTFGQVKHAVVGGDDSGRWPKNVLLENCEEVFSKFPAGRSAGLYPSESWGTGTGVTYGGKKPQGALYDDAGSAARFFNSFEYSENEVSRTCYCPKASKAERCGSSHPTVKPIKLLAWLCKLVTQPGGMILDPFAGTGSTSLAAVMHGFNTIAIEQDATYVEDIKRRLDLWF